jgi:hypothetical protein
VSRDTVELASWIGNTIQDRKEARLAARLAQLAVIQARIDRDNARIAQLNSPSARMIAGMSTPPITVDLADNAVWDAAWRRAHQNKS